MRSICFYFQVHQPFRLRTYRFFDIGENHYYFNDFENSHIMRRIAQRSYLPMNDLLLKLMKKHGKAFKVSFSITGTALEQFEAYAPEVIESFKKLAATGNVEFLAETYAHSLSSVKSKTEFKKQVELHSKKIEELFGQKPKVFRNTELIYSDEIGEMVYDMGYNTMLTEGARHILGWKSPNYMYCNARNPKLKVLLKNYRLSDDIAFRFSHHGWPEWPLTADKFVGWLNDVDAKEEVVNLFMDYETFGEHQWQETGIFEFMKALPQRVFSNSNYTFNTPSELSQQLQPVSAIHVPQPISWADEERDLTAWLGNELQDEAFNSLYGLEEKIRQCTDQKILLDWRYLQTSDHFYYMCTKWFSDGDVHKYFNPYGTPYDAFINFMNVLSDFIIRIDNHLQEQSFNKLEIEKPYIHVEAVAEKNIKKAIAKKEFSLDAKQIKKIIKQVEIKDLYIYLHNKDVKVSNAYKEQFTKKQKDDFIKFSKGVKNFTKTDIQKAVSIITDLINSGDE